MTDGDDPMPESALAAFVDAEDAAWEACWEVLLLLPTGDLPTGLLHREAAQAILECGARTGDNAPRWLVDELRNGRCFVADQLAEEPDEHWERLLLMLEGAIGALAFNGRFGRA